MGDVIVPFPVLLALKSLIRFRVRAGLMNLFALIGALFVAFQAVPARAQFGGQPPKVETTDINDVDLRSGQWSDPGRKMTIGSVDDPVFVLTYGSSSGSSGLGDTPFDGEAGHPICDVDDYQCQSSPDEVYINYNLQTTDDGDYVVNGDTSTFTRKDGTVYHFTLMPGWGHYTFYNNYVLTKIVRPNGEELTYTWSAGNDYPAVTSSRGYASNKRGMVNLRYENCDANTDDCSTNNHTWPKITGSYSGNTTTFVDPIGGQYKIIYSGSGNGSTITRITPAGVSRTATINVVGAGWYYPGVPVVTKMQSAAGTWNYSFQATLGVYAGTSTSPLGLTRSATNGTDGHITVTDGNSHKWQMQFDIVYPFITNTSALPIDGNFTAYTVSAEGDRIDYQRDNRGNVITATRAAKTGSGLQALIWQANYDAACSNPKTCNQPNYTIDEKGNRTDFTYDPSHGGVLTKTLPADANGMRPQIRYNYQQLSAHYNDANGNRITGAPIWMLVSTSECASSASCTGTAGETVTSYTYDDNLLPITETVKSGDGTASRVTTKTYDRIGNVIYMDGPQPGTADTTRYVWDMNRRLVAVMKPDPDGTGPLPVPVTKTSYDGDGRVTEVDTGTAIDQSDAALAAMTVNQQVITQYDVMGRKIKESLVAGGATYAVTQYSYDADSRLQCAATRMNPAVFSSLPSSACALGAQGSEGPDRISFYTYDAAGQLLKQTKAYGQTAANGLPQLQQDYSTYSYTPNGKVKTVKDANGNLTTYTYDGFDRLVAWAFPSKTLTGTSAPCTLGTVSETTETFAAPTGSLSVAVTGPTETRNPGDDCEKYAYDRVGNRAKLMKRDGNVIRYTFDALDRNIVKDIPGGTAADVYFGYDLRGLQTYARFVSASGLGITNVFDALGQLSSTTNNMGPTSLTLGYKYDSGGNRIRITHPDGTYFTYDYDELDRAKAIKTNGASIVATITYDDQARRLSDTRVAVNTNYGYDPVSRLANLTNDLGGATNDVTSTFEYNHAGQIVKKTRSNDAYAFTGYVSASRPYTVNGLNQYAAAGSASFTYDDNGNLTGDGTNTYVYDVENRMISATTTAGTNTIIYDPLGRLWQVSRNDLSSFQYLQDGDHIVEKYGVSGTSSALNSRFVFGPGEDEPLIWYLQSDLSSPRSFQSDAQGSIVSVADVSGNMQNIIAYDEYGISSYSNTNSKPQFGYTGQVWLPMIGLNYYKARMYSPTLGRFMQTDPIGYKDQNNLYAYVGNDPTNGKDSTGLEGDSDWTKRIIDVIVGTGKVAVGTVITVAGAAGDGASAAAEVGTAGAATPIAVPAAIGSTAAIATGVAIAADGGSQIVGAIMRNTPADPNGGGSNGGGNNSRHAEQRMEQRGVSAERVIEAQRIGRVKDGNTANTVVREVPSAASASGRGIRIVIDRATGRVITVIDKGSKFK